MTYHKGVTNLESRFSHKVVIGFEGYLYLICSWSYSWRYFLVSTPPSSYNRAGLWYIFHFHKVIPGNQFERLVFANSGYRRWLLTGRSTAADTKTTVPHSLLQNIRLNITNGGHACVAQNTLSCKLLPECSNGWFLGSWKMTGSIFYHVKIAMRDTCTCLVHSKHTHCASCSW